jgi:hypothetical protein
MSRRIPTLVLTGLAALATVGLTACGSLDGSAHAEAPAASPAASTASPASGAPSVDPAAQAPAPQPGRTASGGTGLGTGSGAGGGSGTGGTGTGGTGTGTGGSGSGGGQGSNPAPTAPTAKITSFRVVQQPTCPVHGTPEAPFSSPGTDVVIAWSVSGAKGAAIAVDNPGIYGAYGSDYPASGTLSLAFGCDKQGTNSHTYTVWPAGAHDVSKTITVSAHSDG